MEAIDLYLLTREWRDVGDRTRLVFWGVTAEGVARVVVQGFEPVLFVEADTPLGSGRREKVALQSLAQRPVDAVKFPTQKALYAERDRLRALGTPPYESDLKPSDRWLMERFVTGSMRVTGPTRQEPGWVEMTNPVRARALDAPPPRALRVLSLDIETINLDGEILSVAVAARDFERVQTVGPRHDERALLIELIGWISEYDPDVLAGWNLVDFDLTVLAQRCEHHGLAFAIGRGGERARVLEGSPPTARIAGRVVLDGPQTLRSATYSFESLRLGDVAHELCGRGKKIATGVDPVLEIQRMAREDPAALAAYNLEDCRLVLDVIDAADLIGFAVERQRLTGLPIDKAGGSVAAFDHLYLPRLHRAGFVAPDVGDGPEAEMSPGGSVLDSAPGCYDNVVVLDFRSLYPSIIRTWKIDPLGLARPLEDPIEGFDGATFAREGAILPGLIGTLWEARSRARAEGRAAMSTAIKILMNSFYGVLGTPGCRFFDPRLVASITRRGHEIIARTRDRIESGGQRVIYGDTDSLFVLLGADATEADARATARRLAAELNAFWREVVAREHRLESYLELRFDTHFLRFLMPTLRRSEVGTKKRYAGSVRAANDSIQIVIKGLEAVRTDWTPLARETQRELVRRICVDEPWEDWLRSVRDNLLAGNLDDKLVYRKRLRRELDSYAESGAPAHVRAARQQGTSAREVLYVMTSAGPEALGQRQAPIDYAHYLEKQLAAAVDSILPLLGKSFDRVAGLQLRLF